VTKKEQASNTILIATDGSLAAETAAGVAIQIAASQNLSIHGLYVVDEVLALDNMYANYQRELGSASSITARSQLLDQLEAQGSMALESIQTRCRSADVAVTTEMLFGGVPELVLQAAATSQLLALGRRGHGHADSPDRLGCNFRTISRRSTRPILAGGDKERIVHRLVVAYNGSDRAHRALDWASRLQQALPAEIAVVAVQETDGDLAGQWLQEAQAALPHLHFDTCWCLERRGPPAAEIVATAVEIETDLILMGRSGHAAFIDLLVGSTVEYVLKNSPLPILMA
jgi:nucleotide-binding universal stress UspA family protein